MSFSPSIINRPLESLSSERELRQNLAAAYRLFAHFHMDDLTYTHLSARLPGSLSYFISPFGLLFSEVNASDLLKVSLEGEILEGTEYQYNQTGFMIHGALYKARPDIHAIFHLHTPAGIAVSCLEQGLLPLSQFSFHFYKRAAYHGYDSLTLGGHQGERLAKDLGALKVMFLRNHGTLTAGATLHEAFFYAYYLEQACKVQCQVLSTGQAYILPPPEVCEQAHQDMKAFEEDLGKRDWQALIRFLNQKDSSYRS
jgi:ribulose-5-phosphate 4-epimerase/fuculose-1-phosphate aldolase